MSQLTRFSAILMLVLFPARPLPSIYAQGGKAEPLRIEFKRGKASGSYRNKLRGTEQAEYEFSAQRGQTVSVRLKASPAASIDLIITSPDDQPLQFDERDRRIKSAQLPKTGTYHLVIKRTTSARGISSYFFTIAIN